MIPLTWRISEKPACRIHGIKTKIIAASTRMPTHVIECAKAGAHIADDVLTELQAVLQRTLIALYLKGAVTKEIIFVQDV